MDGGDERQRLAVLGLVVLVGAAVVAGLVLDARRDNAFRTQESITMTSSPTLVGEEQLIGGTVLQGTERRSGHVELVAAELVGLEGDGIISLYAMDASSGHVGTARLDTLAQDGRPYREVLRPLAGYRFELTDDASHGLVVGVTPTTDGTTSWDAIRVDYLLDGKPGSQTHRNGGLICVQETPTPCPDPDEDD